MFVDREASATTEYLLDYLESGTAEAAAPPGVAAEAAFFGIEGLALPALPAVSLSLNLLC